jgi:hypothetical protein
VNCPCDDTECTDVHNHDVTAVINIELDLLPLLAAAAFPRSNDNGA